MKTEEDLKAMGREELEAAYYDLERRALVSDYRARNHDRLKEGYKTLLAQIGILRKMNGLYGEDRESKVAGLYLDVISDIINHVSGEEEPCR